MACKPLVMICSSDVMTYKLVFYPKTGFFNFRQIKMGHKKISCPNNFLLQQQKIYFTKTIFLVVSNNFPVSINFAVIL